MTDNMREALRLQREEGRRKEQLSRDETQKIIQTVGSVLATLATIAILV